MLSLPEEILNEIPLESADLWMLKLTCLHLYKLLHPNLGLLNSCILEGNLDRVKMVEKSWGNPWAEETSYFYIDSVEMFDYKFLKESYFSSKYEANEFPLYVTYKGACSRANSEILSKVAPLLKLNYPITVSGLRIIIQNKQYHFLDTFFSFTREKETLWEIAAETLDIEAVRYCLFKRITPTATNWTLKFKDTSYEELHDFLVKCKEIGVRFDHEFVHGGYNIKLREKFLLISLGSKYMIFDFFFSSNLGMIDWENDNLKDFVRSTVIKTFDRQQHNAIERMKIFLQREGVYNQYSDIFLLNDNKIISEFNR